LSTNSKLTLYSQSENGDNINLGGANSITIEAGEWIGLMKVDIPNSNYGVDSVFELIN